jgi:hypothetical protein
MADNISSPWMKRHTVGVCFAIAMIIAVGLFPRMGANDGSNPYSHNIVTWLVIVGLLTYAFMQIGWRSNGRAAGSIIDSRNQMSLSRMQAAAWTILVLSAVLTTAMFHIRIGSVDKNAFVQNLFRIDDLLNV